MARPHGSRRSGEAERPDRRPARPRHAVISQRRPERLWPYYRTKFTALPQGVLASPADHIQHHTCRRETNPQSRNLIAVNLSFAGHIGAGRRRRRTGPDAIRAELPDLILLDLDAARHLWYAALACKHARTSAPAPFPSSCSPPKAPSRTRSTAWRGGADDYITNLLAQGAMACIKAVLRRRAPQLTDYIIDVAGLKLDIVTHRLFGNAQRVDPALPNSACCTSS